MQEITNLHIYVKKFNWLKKKEGNWINVNFNDSNKEKVNSSKRIQKKNIVLGENILKPLPKTNFEFQGLWYFIKVLT